MAHATAGTLVSLCRRLFMGAVALSFSVGLNAAQAADTIKIGFSASLTGALASSGKANLLAQTIWAEEVNAKGGLLGKKVELVYYDDQTNAATVPGIYAKLVDVDKVDLLMGAATNLIVAAMPLIMERQKLVMVMVALGSNEEFKYSRFFQSASWGSNASIIGEGYFNIANQISPKPKTVAFVGADAEFSNNVLTGARAVAKKQGFEVVYDRSYPPNTVDFTPIVRAMQAAKPDLVFVAAYPIDSVGLVRSATELGLKTQLFGGAMVGMQYATFMQQLSNKLDRVVNYHLYVPSTKLSFPGIEAFLKTYQGRAAAQGTDPLGFYQPPFAYAAMQVLEQAIKATGTLDDGKLADYIHKTSFPTIVGDIKFDEKGEWANPRLLMVQFQNLQGSDLGQFLTPGKQVILYPPAYKDGAVEAPFTK